MELTFYNLEQTGDARKEADVVEEKTQRSEAEGRREQMLQTIIKVIQGLDGRELEHVYHFVLHIR